MFSLDIVNAQEYLQAALNSGMIDITSLKANIAMAERKKYLEGHNIWQGKNGSWYTKLNQDGIKTLVRKATKEAVEEEIIKYEKRLEDRPTVKDIFYRFINQKYRYKDISKSTYSRYEADYKRYIEGKKIESVEFCKLTEEYLEDFIRCTIADDDLTSKGYSNLRTIIRGMLLYAKGKYTQISAESFFGDMQFSKNTFRKKIIDKKEQVFSEEEIPLIMEYLEKNLSLYNLGIMLDFHTGLRNGELSTIKRTDISKDGNCYFIHIQRTEISYKDNGSHIVAVKEYPKSSAGDRYVFCNDKAAKIIEKIIELNPEGEYLFEKNKSRIRERSFNNHLKAACRNLGILPRTMHKIRKTYGTVLIDSGVDEAVIVEQMGHSDIYCTKQYYYFSNKNRDKKIEQLGCVTYN